MPSPTRYSVAVDKSGVSLVIDRADPDAPEAQALIAALGARLTAVTGRFSPVDLKADPALVFLLARQDGLAVACGALRPAGEATFELKRLYCARPGQGIGARMVEALEAEARLAGGARLLVETGAANRDAIRFYRRLGYRPCAPWGRYVGDPAAVCLDKRL
jgi:GNAT superfamily N-acetyltransferase